MRAEVVLKFTVTIWGGCVCMPIIQTFIVVTIKVSHFNVVGWYVEKNILLKNVHFKCETFIDMTINFTYQNDTGLFLW